MAGLKFQNFMPNTGDIATLKPGRRKTGTVWSSALPLSRALRNTKQVHAKLAKQPKIGQLSLTCIFIGALARLYPVK
jgi:hypothetical protein